MIKHTVFFKLKLPVGSAAETDFLKAALALGSIPGVIDLVCVKQIGAKNAFTYGLVMAFEDDPAYQAYTAHPSHVTFVAERWLPEVETFMEIDYVTHPLSASTS